MAVPVALEMGAHVRREHDELDLGGEERVSEVSVVAEPLRDRRRKRVVVQASRQLPDAPRTKDVGGLEPEQELLQIVQPVERRHGTGERAGGRPVDPSDPRPKR